jgi:hypothetical protein
MNIQMNEFHGIDIHDITSPSNDMFHEEQTWGCLDIVGEPHELSPWCWIGFLLVPKCVHSCHTHANDKNIGIDN